MQVIRVSKTINAPLRYVYNWCTDFREDDPALTGSKTSTKILEKTKKRVVFSNLSTTDDGSQKIGVNFVALKPPNSWHLDYFGEDENEIGDYKLSSLGRDKTKLSMVFKEAWKTEKIPTVEEQVESTNRFWDKLIIALDKEYSSSK